MSNKEYDLVKVLAGISQVSKDLACKLAGMAAEVEATEELRRQQCTAYRNSVLGMKKRSNRRGPLIRKRTSAVCMCR